MLPSSPEKGVINNHCTYLVCTALQCRHVLVLFFPCFDLVASFYPVSFSELLSFFIISVFLAWLAFELCLSYTSSTVLLLLLFLVRASIQLRWFWLSLSRSLMTT